MACVTVRICDQQCFPTVKQCWWPQAPLPLSAADVTLCLPILCLTCAQVVFETVVVGRNVAAISSAAVYLANTPFPSSPGGGSRENTFAKL